MANEIVPSGGRDITHYNDLPAVGSSNGEYPLHRGASVEELWAMAWRNRWIIVACVIAAAALAIAYNRTATRIYQSSALIRIQHPTRPALTEEGLDQLNLSGPDDIETEMEEIRSRDFLAGVVDTLALQVQLAGEFNGQRQRVFSHVEVEDQALPGRYVLKRAGADRHVMETLDGRPIAEARAGQPIRGAGVVVTLAPEAQRYSTIPFAILSGDAAIGGVQGGLIVQRVDFNVNMIRVGYRNPDPTLAAAIPNAVADHFLTRRKSNQSTEASNTVEFLRGQIDSISRQLRAAEDDLREFQESHGVVEPGAEGQATIGQVAALEANRDALEAERSSIGALLREAEAAERKNPLERSPYRRLVAFPSLIRMESSSTLLSSLVALETERSELLTRRTLQDPDVEALTQRIESIEDQLHEIATTYHRGLSSQVSSFQAAIGRERGQLATIPGKAVEMNRRQREAMLLQEVYTLLQTRLKEAQIAEAARDPAARIVDRAIVPEAPIAPQSQRNLILALFLGLSAGFGLAFVRERMDKTIRTKEQVQAITGAPIIGMIPRFDLPALRANGGKAARLLPSRNAGSRSREMLARFRAPKADRGHAVAEAFRSLRTNITFTTADRKPRILLLTSAQPGDGKTTTAANLAHAFALQGLRVLLVDSDMRQGTVHELFGLPRDPGLTTLLVNDLPIDQAVREVRADDGRRFDVLTAGRVSPYPAELLGSSRLASLLEDLVKRYDQIVIDTPPISVVTDAAILSRHVDGVLVVVRAGRTEESALRFAMEQLRLMDAPLKGTVLNDIGPRDHAYGYYGYDRKYGYHSDAS